MTSPRGEVRAVPLLAERPMHPLDRLVITAYGLLGILMGVLEAVDHTADREVLVPTVWPVVFVVVGVVALVYALTASWPARQWSGGLFAVALLGRGSGLLWGIAQGTVASVSGALLGWCVWSGFAVALVLLWRYTVPVEGFHGPRRRR